MNMNDDALLAEFVTESREHLENIEPDLLVLERDADNTDAEVVNCIFRAIHSIKGAAGFFGLEALKNLSHAMESVLMKIRDGVMKPTPEIIEPLLVGVDRLNVMVNDIGQSEAVVYQDLVDRLEALLSGNPVPVQVQKTSEPATTEVASVTERTNANQFVVDTKQVEQCLSFGQNLYELRVRTAEDLTAKNRDFDTFCQCLAATGVVLSHLSVGDDNSIYRVLYATVLELDLVAAASDIEVTQVTKAEASVYLGRQPQLPANSPLAKTEEKPAATTNKTLESSKATASKPGKASGESETVRVKIDLLNKLMDLAGEMVLSRNQLLRALEKTPTGTPSSQASSSQTGIASVVQNIDLITSDLQEHIMQTRMQPIGSVFGKFPRLVRDLSKQLGKEIELIMHGEDVELDKSILESLSDPLTHIIRNCCDHALEKPEERTGMGKTASGKITLKAYHEGGQINISIADDGKGIDVQRVAQKAIANGAITEAEVKKMSSQELVNLIFLPGLSTAEKVSDVSGRGVGMDVVRTNIEKIGGTISIETSLGLGTTVLFRLPLTLAIIPSLVVGVGEHRYAMPQINLVELVRIRANKVDEWIERLGSATVLRLRGNLLPLVRLSDVLGVSRKYYDNNSGQYCEERRDAIADERKKEVENTSSGMYSTLVSQPTDRRDGEDGEYNIMVLKVGLQQYGLIVDNIYDAEEIVVKPLSGYLKACRCFAGATIMGDGRVAMILDAGGILTYSKLSFSEINEEQRRRMTEDAVRSAFSKKQSVILFNNSPDEVFAIPLSSILRLEKFNVNDIQRVGGREFYTNRGRSISLMRLENHLPVSPMPYEQEEAFLILPQAGCGTVGLIVSQILDTLEVEVDLEDRIGQYPGVTGSAIVNERLTMFVDPSELLELSGILAHA